MKKKIILSLLAIIILAVGLYFYVKNLNEHYYNDDPIRVSQVEADGPVPFRKWLPQSWDEATRDKFWFTSQGAQIMPYSWFTWLEQKDNEVLFRNTTNMERLGYLPRAASKSNPAGLPVGFAVTRNMRDEEPHMGFTCAACHTNQLDYGENKLLIDGAPTLANFVLFYKELNEALSVTYKDKTKFERFASKVLGEGYTSDDATKLKSEMKEVAQDMAKRQAVNALPSDYPKDFTSYARLDAFGNIANAGSAFALNDLSNKNYTTGPVSYPFLWGTHQSDVVQWNASAPNTPIVGPLFRNVGEVVGVFGGLQIEEAPWWQKLIGIDLAYSSTVDFKGLGELETMIRDLRSPQWPEDILPEIDDELAGKGAVIFQEYCQSCHKVIPRDKEGEKYKAERTALLEVGTDPITAWNVKNHKARTEILEGHHQEVLAGDVYGSMTDAISIPLNGVIGVILKRPISAFKAGLAPYTKENNYTVKDVDDLLLEHMEHRNILDDTLPHYEEVPQVMASMEMSNVPMASSVAEAPEPGPFDDIKIDSSLVYKGRPLNGIWATAPYLHNGSVPNLWELLVLPSERKKTFKVGSRQFQPDSVGYVTTEGPSTFKVLGDDGKIFPGNSNLGHDYGTQLTDDEKWALVEYMKTL